MRLAAAVLLLTAPAAAQAPALKFSPYGFLRASYVGASAAVESFGQPNLSAYTAAAPPTAPSPDSARGSFQWTQSRVGAVVSSSEDVSGRLEFDFIDFSKASPTTKANPRVRRAAVDWKPAEGWLLRAGQDWDLTSPLAPHTMNPVGHYFESGDIAFMRVQFMALKKDGAFEHGVALGGPAANNGPADNGVELGAAPTLALRETWSPGPGLSLGASAIGASMRPDAGGGRFGAGAGTVFVEAGARSALNLRTEAYYAVNSVDLGLLGIGARNMAAGANAREAGAYATARWKASEKWAVFGGGGGAWALRPSVQPPASVRGTGLLWNATARAGLERSVGGGLWLWAEAAGLFTRHRLSGGMGDRSRLAAVLELGTQLNFGS